jgi:hypothetical protein
MPTGPKRSSHGREHSLQAPAIRKIHLVGLRPQDRATERDCCVLKASGIFVEQRDCVPRCGQTLGHCDPNEGGGSGYNCHTLYHDLAT